MGELSLTPDFYLPQLDLYVKVSTSAKRPHAAEQHALYMMAPQVCIVTLYVDALNEVIAEPLHDDRLMHVLARELDDQRRRSERARRAKQAQPEQRSARPLPRELKTIELSA